METFKLPMIVRTTCMSIMSLLLISAAGCASTPGFLKLSGESFTPNTLVVKRVYILASIDSSAGKTVANSIVDRLQNELMEHGVLVQSEIQILNPIALGSDIGMSLARRFGPDAIILVRVRSATSVVGAMTYTRWGVAFDLLDNKLKGLWRGNTKILRTDAIDQSTAAIAQQVWDDLQTKKVLKITGANQ